MARLDTPLLSFHARGQIAKTLVAYVWKGLDCVREYVVPHDPKSPLQLIARHNFRRSIHAWRIYLQDLDVVDAWHRLAAQDPRPLTGYTAAYSELIYAFQLINEPSFVAALTPVAGGNAQFKMLNMEDGSQGAEPGHFHIYRGSEVDAMSLFDSQPIDPAGDVNVTGLVFPGSTVYLQLVKQQIRSGIHRMTVA